MEDSLPMNYSLLDEWNESITYLAKDVYCSFFWDLRVLIDVLLKVAIAYFLDNVVVMAALHDIEYADNVFGFKQL